MHVPPIINIDRARERFMRRTGIGSDGMTYIEEKAVQIVEDLRLDGIHPTVATFLLLFSALTVLAASEGDDRLGAAKRMWEDNAGDMWDHARFIFDRVRELSQEEADGALYTPLATTTLKGSH